jgi:hypothetical protein
LSLLIIDVENPDLFVPEPRACNRDAPTIRRKGGETISDFAAVQFILRTLWTPAPGSELQSGQVHRLSPFSYKDLVAVARDREVPQNPGH